MRIGDSNLDYDDNFKLFITTKMPNPHYMPEIFIKVTLINFTVTFKGLEDQLLGDVVIQEKPEIEAKRDEIIVTMDNDSKSLKNIENIILKLLSESTEEQILDEDTLIDVLDDSKIKSREINKRVEQSKIIEEEIDCTRNQYRSVAIRGSILYFVIADLSGIDPMYQYSLVYVKRLFNNAIEKSEKKDTLEERLDLLIENITRMLYTNVSRGLFEAHKIIYSFLITTSINRNNEKITPEGWGIILRGGGVLPSEQVKKMPKNPEPKMLSPQGWELIYYVDLMMEAFNGITEHTVKNIEEWRAWALKPDAYHVPLPQAFEHRLSPF
jgi:dynein heavy chain